MLGPSPVVSVPVGPHTVQPGECDKLCADGQSNSCQVALSLVTDYRAVRSKTDGGSACPTGYLDGGSVTLACVKQSPNPAYYDDGTCPAEAIGRPPVGFRPSSRALVSSGDHLARAAEIEAASVDGFLAVREALARFGAPSDLARECLRAAAEEARHASRMTALASARGASPAKVRVPTTRFDREIDLALENAVVGLVYETFGALLALHQAERAADADVRTAMREIAEDECRHAELSMRIDAWLRTRLDADERALVDGARAAAIVALSRDVASGRLALPREVGAPPRDVALRMVAKLAEIIWHPGTAAAPFMKERAGATPADRMVEVRS